MIDAWIDSPVKAWRADANDLVVSRVRGSSATERGTFPDDEPVRFSKLGVLALVEMVLFITVFVAYAYVWRRGGLEWD